MSIAAIGAVAPPLEPAFQARAGTQGGPAFVVTTEPAAVQQPASGAAGVSAGALSATMLALQEAGATWSPAGQSGDRQARQRGRDLLAALAALQRDLLGCADPAASLSRLAALLADVPDAEDPQLGEILGAIRLRAGIEAIRLGQRRGGAPPLA
ncbi:flagellar assembly protein FliX [Lichenicoccus sp.]|uniref:flagellar assembly protein FliX n=1 Tax=Lichenicoccus sp. TaxID=2781899 RepID=UPI003D14483C